MQAQIRTGWTALAVLCAALIGSHTTATWASTSTSTLTQTNQARLANEAEQLAAQGRFGDAATRYESLAAQAGNTDRDRFILKAARNAQLAGDHAKAQRLLELTGKKLNARDSALHAIVSADLLLRAEQPDRAIAQLDQIPLPLPEEFSAEVLAVRTQALFVAGRIVLAVNTAVERERTLKTESELTQNRRLLWNNLKQAASAGRDLTAPAGANRVTAGWLELAKLFNSGGRDAFAFNRSLSDWRSRYPGHPGSTMLTISSSTASTATHGSQRIGLLLPLSGKQQAAGIAIRDGFLGAALQLPADQRPAIQVFDTNEGGALAAYQRATQNDVQAVVGPLLKEDVEALANTQQVGVLTLALNLISGEQAPPAFMFQFALDPEEEARQVAQRARDEGHSRAIVLTPNNEWGQRVQRAFVAELAAQGGVLVDQRSYDANSRDYVGLSKQLFASRKPPQARALDDALGNKRPMEEVRDDFDYIFIAAQASQAKQLRPALRFVLPDAMTPVYSTSDSYEAETNNSDLEGLRFVDMPWVINRDSTTGALHDQMARLWSAGLRNRSRLYAFGIDAFALINWLQTPQPQLASPLQGATGLLALDQVGRVRRQADWAQIVSGKAQVLPNLSTTSTP